MIWAVLPAAPDRTFPIYGEAAEESGGKFEKLGGVLKGAGLLSRVFPQLPPQEP